MKTCYSCVWSKVKEIPPGCEDIIKSGGYGCLAWIEYCDDEDSSQSKSTAKDECVCPRLFIVGHEAGCPFYKK